MGGYQGVYKRPDAKAEVTWHIAMDPAKCRALDKDNQANALMDQAEKLMTLFALSNLWMVRSQMMQAQAAKG